MLNIQGLLSKNVNKLQSKELSIVFQHNDIVLMTETWLGDEALVQVNGFTHFKLNRTVKKRNTKRNSGGLIAYIRNELVTDGMLFLTDSDDIMWLRLEGSSFNNQDDIFICLSYNVPEGSSRQGLIDNIDIYDRIADHMVHIQNITNNHCVFLICGDFNARISNYADYVEDDSAEHIHVLPDDYLVDTPLGRVSEDKGFNRYGSQMLDFCKETGLRIVNGRVGSDKGIGKCTYVGSAGKSVVDYVIASQCLFPVINTFEVSDPNLLSDHCIVQFSIILHDSVLDAESETSSGSFCNYKYVWKNNEVESYQNALQSEDVQGTLNDLKTNISNLKTADELNSNVKSFQETIESVCNPLFKKDISKARVQNFSTFNESNQPWFSENCKQKRDVFF